MTPTLRLVRLLAAAVASLLLASTVALGAAAPARADTYIPITGTGSTWSQNALDQWRKNVAANYGMTVNYSGVGSSAGRRDFIAQTVDFAVSEIPFQAAPEDGSAPEQPTTAYAYMPIVAGGTSFMYNLQIGGKRVTNLRLSGEVITKIFTGAITNWNDPAIQADNPGLAMPDKGIVPVVRSDGSGSTAQFTLWMSKQYPALWSAYNGGPGLTSQYKPTGAMKAQNGSLGVAGYVAQGYGEGAITYVEYSYAKNSGFPVAKVLNNSGYYIEPKATSVAVALLQAQINQDPSSPDYLTQILDNVYNSGDPRSYPLSSYSYMIIPTATNTVFTAEKGNTLGTFARYMLCEGQQQADTLGYSPLPMNLVIAGSDQIKKIPGAGSTGVDVNSCNNPTFSPGDGPESNALAKTAPQPAPCDKQGPDQCVTGTGGAAETPTDTTGTGNGGSSADAGSAGSGGGGTGAAASGAAAQAASSGGAASYDENGALISGGSGTVVAGGAVSSPFTLPDPGMGPQQWLMVAAGVLLLAAVIVPPLASRRLKRGGRS
ncbi:phosphate ABC transporter substrate-binding protein PstS [Herbiconiux moechotypicola]|uniref:PBP domain-containing protein n=1 Tax=Herbiconiux moechotypicola TaxID=637393 RepID=A0ABN3D969_9MICO|nr:phosphate ABC transporter substrate-binding protein PstS [Herbiconiux moechotypicola]MCS5728266.1 phosphate ABC transporter substrate-binding protein PstS [Herbiconiux moechotypicola]